MCLQGFNIFRFANFDGQKGGIILVGYYGGSDLQTSFFSVYKDFFRSATFAKIINLMAQSFADPTELIKLCRASVEGFNVFTARHLPSSRVASF